MLLEILGFEVLGYLVLFTGKVSGMIYEGLMGWIFTYICLFINQYACTHKFYGTSIVSCQMGEGEVPLLLNFKNVTVAL